MSNGCLVQLCYVLLICVDYLLNIIFTLYNYLLIIPKLLLKHFVNVNMTESAKKRKRNTDNQTVSTRGAINVNWQKLLSSKLIMDNNTEKPVETDKNHYTGTFRRTRKKQTRQINNTVENNLKSLNLSGTYSKGNGSDHKTNILEHNTVNNKIAQNDNEFRKKKNNLTKFLAMDCEMVGIGHGGNDNMLARVSLVNKFGDCIYDKYVKAREEVTDYRTDISGVRREDLLNGEDFTVVQKEISELIRGRILVGHSLKNDLAVLFLSHPKRSIRDTSRYKPFRKITKGSTPSLKRLAKEILGIEIQHGEHSSVEDARATMQLYCTVAKKWEATMSEKRGYDRRILEE
ncbi:uncharacterized protein LOC131845340 [Achroia grisella]|uniref:uncharacterized protein LOC131845340 n=1 Tax=Achroia grisella TaxID=688607 RepID=UPI0027D24699|nr:uncharacterized protein LOC131845340 [Achroia grisella]